MDKKVEAYLKQFDRSQKLPNRNFSFQNSLNVESIDTPRIYSSAPDVLIHDPKPFVYKPLKAFAPSLSYLSPTIFYQPLFTDEEISYWNREKIDLSTFEQELSNFLDKKFRENFPQKVPRTVLVKLIASMLIYCRNENMNNATMNAVCAMFYYTHLFFISSLWRKPSEIYDYFKQMILMHSVLYPPHHANILTIVEGKNILMKFSTLYLRHLPLIRVLSLTNYKINFEWLNQDQLPTKKK